MTVFVGVLSIEGTLGKGVDAVATKTGKAVMTNFVPVVGKILGDAVETVIGCSVILKNAISAIGIITIISICAIPIIKLSILTILYYLTSAIIQPIADERIVKLIENMADTFKILLGILFSVSFMLIIRNNSGS